MGNQSSAPLPLVMNEPAPMQVPQPARRERKYAALPEPSFPPQPTRQNRQSSLPRPPRINTRNASYESTRSNASVSTQASSLKSSTRSLIEPSQPAVFRPVMSTNSSFSREPLRTSRPAPMDNRWGDGTLQEKKVVSRRKHESLLSAGDDLCF